MRRLERAVQRRRRYGEQQLQEELGESLADHQEEELDDPDPEPTIHRWYRQPGWPEWTR